MNRTQQEILDRIEERKAQDVFGFETNDYIDFLDYEHVQPFLKEGVGKEEWEKVILFDPLKEIKNYMEFAWDKANNCRSLSSQRSLMHMMAWIWLNGDDDFCFVITDQFEKNYCYYGKPILELICDYYDIDCSELDDGIRTNYE